MDNPSARLEIVNTKTVVSSIILDASWPEEICAMASRRVVVIDAAIGQWTSWVADRIKPETVLSLPISEQEKSLATVHKVYEWFGHIGVMRDTLVVGVGGGVLTDLVGYACATYLRGLSFAAVPTSLLAQVDAAIGGKVGVNTAWGKNLVGAFHPARVVALEPEFLTTLPLREWRAGLGEVMKSALIHGGGLYESLNTVNLADDDTALWTPIIKETAKIKVEFVNQDLYEDGPRMFLNFGHTVGHALETLLGYGVLSHGEAVGLGALVELGLSERLRGLDSQVRSRVYRWMTTWGLPTTFPGVNVSKLWQQLQGDKKARSTGLVWVLLEAVGQPVLVPNIPEGLVQSVIEELS